MAVVLKVREVVALGVVVAVESVEEPVADAV